MKGLRAKLFASVLVLAAATACSHRIQPVYNVQNHPLPRAAASLSQEQLDRIAQEAATARGWLVDKIGPGQFRVIQKWRTHVAEAALSIAPSGYSIKFTTATNLREGEGHIHRAYNQHVTALETEIERRLLTTVN